MGKIRVRFGRFILGLVLAVGFGCGLPAHAAASTVHGDAYGVSAELLNVISVDPTPHVVLPSQGGAASTTVLGVDISPVIDSGTVTVSTSGTAGNGNANADSDSTVDQVDILDGLITATLVSASSSSTCSGGSASSSAAGSTFVSLAVNGVPILVNPAPNTIIAIPGVGSVTLNEQITGGNGTSNSSLTVNMIHVVLDGLVDGDIVVASAHSHVDCAASPAPTPTPTPGVCNPAPGPDPQPAPTSPIVSGEAFGLSVDLLNGVTVDPVPHVVLAPEGGASSATVLGVSVPTILSSGTLTVSTSGSTGPTSASSDTTSRVEGINVLGGLVTATVLNAHSTSTCNGTTASSSASGTLFTGLTVLGLPVLLQPAPNTMIGVPGVGTIILNERTTGGNGSDTSSLTVNMIHVVLDAAFLEGDIVIGSAHSDVNCDPINNPVPTGTPAPAPTCTPAQTPPGGPTATATPGPGATATATSTPPAGATATATPDPGPTATMPGGIPSPTQTPGPLPTEPPGIEICSNGADDDNNGLTDCEEQFCACEPIGDDPGTIVFGKPVLGPGHDKLYVHGMILPKTPYDLSTEEIGIVLSNVLNLNYSETIPVPLGEKLKYRNRLAVKNKSGIASFSIVRKLKKRGNFVGHMFKITTYGDLSDAIVPTMTFQIRVGNDAFEYTGDWKRTRKGWKLTLPK